MANTYLSWASDPSADVVQPSPSLLAAGYTAGQRPTSGNINWLFATIAGQLRGLSEQAYGTSMTTALEPNFRLLGGGLWSWSAPQNQLTWGDTFSVAIPGLPDSQNAVAAGSCTLTAGYCAYITANAPFQAQGDLSGGTYEVTNLSYVAGITVGMSVTGGYVPSGATVTAISGKTLTLSQAPTQTSSQATLTFVSSSAPSVQTALMSSLAVAPQTIIFARRYDSDVSQALVGVNSGQMALRDGESKTLMGPGYGSSVRLTAAAAITQRQALYANVTNGQVAPVNAASGAAANQSAFVGFAESAAASGAYAHVVSSGVLGGFAGLVPSAPYYCDPANVGGITNGKPTGSGQAVVPVGVALSATQLLINPAAGVLAAQVSNNLTVTGNLTVGGAATLNGAVYATSNAYLNTASFSGGIQPATDKNGIPQTLSVAPAVSFAGAVSTAGGIKRSIFGGGYLTTNFPGGSQYMTTTYGGTDAARRIPMAFVGSVLSLSVSFDRAITQTCALGLLVNGTTVVQQNITKNSSNTGGYALLQKGSYSFNPGDNLSLSINFGATGVSVSAQGEIVVESVA